MLLWLSLPHWGIFRFKFCIFFNDTFWYTDNITFTEWVKLISHSRKLPSFLSCFLANESVAWNWTVWVHRSWRDLSSSVGASWLCEPLVCLSAFGPEMCQQNSQPWTGWLWIFHVLQIQPWNCPSCLKIQSWSHSLLNQQSSTELLICICTKRWAAGTEAPNVGSPQLPPCRRPEQWYDAGEHFRVIFFYIYKLPLLIYSFTRHISRSAFY